MKFLVIGLGSMGKRRIRNLHAHGEKDIIGFDLSAKCRAEAEKEYGIRTTLSLKSLEQDMFDAVIISTPPNAHGEYIRFALKHKKHFFTEVSTSDDGYAEISQNKNTQLVMAPSCTLRFFAPIKLIKSFLDEGRIGKVLAFNYHVGQYLPDWHPWEDYRKVFFSRKETGACRELFPFELCWLNSLMQSRPTEVSGFLNKVSPLDMDAEDILMAHLRYENGTVGTIFIDVISRKPIRNITFLGSEGTLEWRWQDWKILLYSSKTKMTEEISVQKEIPTKGYTAQSEKMHADEIHAFLEAVYKRAPYPYTFKEEKKNIEMLIKLIDAQKTA